MALLAPHNSRTFFVVLTAFGALVAVSFQALPFGNFNGVPLSPAFPLILLFYWAVYRPEYCPHVIAFLAGLFQDIISGGPLGLWALVYLIIFEGVLRNRLFFVGRAAYSALAGFAMAAGLTAVIAWLLACIYFWMVLSPMPILGQMGLTILVYPPTAWVLGVADRMIGSPDR